MLLHSCHGTILRLERDTLRLTHARLVLGCDIATDHAMPLPPEGITRSLAGRNGVAVLPCEAQGTVHFVRAGKHLRVGPERYPRFSADAPGPLETLWLLPPDDVGRLRDLLIQAWGLLESGGTLHLSDLAMLGDPLLPLGDRTVDLATTRPGADTETPDRLTFPAITLHRATGSHARPGEILIFRPPLGPHA